MHYVRAVGGARDQRVDYGLVITQHADLESGPAVAPDGGGKHDWIQLLVLDAVAGQLWWPVAVKPVTTTVGPEADGSRAVGEQLQIRGCMGSSPGAERNCGRSKEW